MFLARKTNQNVIHQSQEVKVVYKVIDNHIHKIMDVIDNHTHNLVADKVEMYVYLRGYCTPGPYFWSLCVFSQK